MEQRVADSVSSEGQGRDVVLDVQDLQTHLFTRWGVTRAVDGVSFSIREGETLGLVGESGSGKTMTALSLLRLLPEAGRIVSGRVLLDGDDIVRMPPSAVQQLRGRKVSMVLQDPQTALNPVFTVGNQLMESIATNRSRETPRDFSTPPGSARNDKGDPPGSARNDKGGPPGSAQHDNPHSPPPVHPHPNPLPSRERGPGAPLPTTRGGEVPASAGTTDVDAGTTDVDAGTTARGARTTGVGAGTTDVDTSTTKRGRGWVRERAIEVLRMMRVAAPERRLADFPHQMSGGMKQRVVGGIAIESQPRLLIADEPTTALDVTIQAQYLNLLKEVQRETGVAILFITHDLGVVARMCDRVAVMYAGRIVEQGGIHELFDNPSHPYTQALLGSIPRMEERVERLTAIEGQPPALFALPQGCRFAERCPHVHDRCEETYPSEFTGPDGHTAACWLLEETWKRTSC